MSAPAMNLTLPDISNVTAFIKFWDQATFGSFHVIVPLLAILSVFLVTRSVSLTLVVLILVCALTGNYPLAVLAGGVGLAYMVYKAVWRGD